MLQCNYYYSIATSSILHTLLCIITALAGGSVDMGATVVLVTAFAFTLEGLVTVRFVEPRTSVACVVMGADTKAGWVVSIRREIISLVQTKHISN